jgi:hypothetical protein
MTTQTLTFSRGLDVVAGREFVPQDQGAMLRALLSHDYNRLRSAIRL